MELKRFGNKLIVRLEQGEEIVESLKTICRENNIRLGSVSGLGAVDKAVIGLYELGSKQYHSKELSKDMEITCLTGNITRMNEDVYLHLHITLADRTFQAVGGHLNYALVSCTAEIIIDIFEGQVERVFDEKVGLNFFKF